MTKTSDSPNPLPFAPAAERNRAPIQSVLEKYLPVRARVLEIGAGTGQHAVAFSRAMPLVSWLATDRSDALPDLQARLRTEGPPGMPDAMVLDIPTGPWPEGRFDAAFTANTCHIMPWENVCAMVAGVARVLTSNGLFLVYGPFMSNGRHTSEGNERFDLALRSQDPTQGLRSLESLESEAGRHQLVQERVIPMPANNMTIVFRRHD